MIKLIASLSPYLPENIQPSFKSSLKFARFFKKLAVGSLIIGVLIGAWLVFFSYSPILLGMFIIILLALILFGYLSFTQLESTVEILTDNATDFQKSLDLAQIFMDIMYDEYTLYPSIDQYLKRYDFEEAYFPNASILSIQDIEDAEAFKDDKFNEETLSLFINKLTNNYFSDLYDNAFDYSHFGLMTVKLSELDGGNDLKVLVPGSALLCGLLEGIFGHLLLSVESNSWVAEAIKRYEGIFNSFDYDWSENYPLMKIIEDKTIVSLDCVVVNGVHIASYLNISTGEESEDTRIDLLRINDLVSLNSIYLDEL